MKISVKSSVAETLPGGKGGLVPPGPSGWERIFQDLRKRLGWQDKKDAPRSPEGGLPSVSQVAGENHGDPFRVLVATMISLRTKDEVTYTASRRLFEKAPSPAALAALPETAIEKLIYPAGFYKTKAASIRETARRVERDYGGKVPADRELLMAFPGVGRKTANLVLNLGFGIDAICVDTHVHRISNRAGWVETKTPEETEAALGRVMPRKFWIPLNELLVKYGQTVCTPVSPHCGSCPL
ncbi:MAG: endonuclease III, partial [Spirochaetales bacterium]|nr:endonuclease III [Spirochaetales bacterium]